MLKGVVAPNLTFFDREGRVDHGLCREHLKWMLKRGVNGFFVTGTYGCGYLMTPRERVRVFEIAQKAAAQKKGAFVIGHVGCGDLESSLYLVREACEKGLAAVSAIEPFQYAYTERERIAYYEALVGASSVPVYAYNNPALTGRAISETMLRSLREAGVGGIKDSSVDMKLITAALSGNAAGEEDFQYITGTASGWLSVRKLGIDTMIAGMCNYIPELIAALYEKSFTDEVEAARLYRLVSDTAAAVKGKNSVITSHLALLARGFDAGWTRPPLRLDFAKDETVIGKMGESLRNALQAL